MERKLRAAADTVDESTTLHLLARAGYGASGLVHVLIGGIALSVGVTGRGQADQIGALAALAESRIGLAALWAVAALLAALGIYHAVHGVAMTGQTRTRRWGRRLGEWGQGIAFLVLAGIAAAVAMGARPDPDENAREASRGLLTAPGGTVLLILVGAGVMVAGGAWVWMGCARTFRARIRLPESRWAWGIVALGAVGCVMKGLAFGVVGIFLVVAAGARDPDAAGGLDAAIGHLHRLPGGGAIIVGIGLGFIAYGIFCGLRAWLAKL